MGTVFPESGVVRTTNKFWYVHNTFKQSVASMTNTLIGCRQPEPLLVSQGTWLLVIIDGRMYAVMNGTASGDDGIAVGCALVFDMQCQYSKAKSDDTHFSIDVSVKPMDKKSCYAFTREMFEGGENLVHPIKIANMRTHAIDFTREGVLPVKFLKALREMDVARYFAW